MAAHTLELKLNWENGATFTMKSKLDAGDEINIVEIAENADMESIWYHVRELCLSYIGSRLADIGTEMMA